MLSSHLLRTRSAASLVSSATLSARSLSTITRFITTRRIIATSLSAAAAPRHSSASIVPCAIHSNSITLSFTFAQQRRCAMSTVSATAANSIAPDCANHENADSTTAAGATSTSSSSSTDTAHEQTTTQHQRRFHQLDLNSSSLGSDKSISYWLFLCSGVVLGMVTLGGLTRLTKSGLSMVEWKPTSFIPPRTEVEWNEEFAKYKAFPEYQRVNNQMSLEEFKFIYQMEFYHRLLGRSLGIVFALPCAYFAMRGRINRALASRLAIAFLAGGTQGAIGWWMVKSGLENPHSTQQSAAVHVSPYRLATHLISAFGIYALLFSTAMRVYPSRFTTHLKAGTSDYAFVRKFFELPEVKRLRLLTTLSTVSVAATVFSGAFVAGNEAGLVYNEWPMMGNGFVPDDLVSPYLSPKWRNMFENSTTVQFQHRMLAYTTTGLVVATFLLTRRLRNVTAVRELLTQAQQSGSSTALTERLTRIQRAAHSMVGMVSIQVTLGISTLLMYVPVSLATLHQAGSLCLLTIVLWMGYEVSQDGKGASKRLGDAMEAGGKQSGGGASTAFTSNNSTLTSQLRITLRDLTRGKVHRGTFYTLAAVFLGLGVVQGLAEMARVMRGDADHEKEVNQTKLIGKKEGK